MREMTIEDYERQKRIIDNDIRYTPALKEFAKKELLETFYDINNYYPNEVGQKKQNAEN